MQTVQSSSVGVANPSGTAASPHGASAAGRNHRRRTAILAGAAVVAVGGAAAGVLVATSGGSSPHSVTLTATEYTFSVPATVPAGLTKVTLRDDGVLAHQADLLKLDAGVTDATIEAALRKSAEGYVGLATLEGGPGGIPAGTTGTAWVNLQAGSYVVACFLRGGSATGPNHAMLGMVQPLTVTAGTSSRKPPASSGQVTLLDHEMSLPAGFGRGVYRVVNAGTQDHELDILALTPGKTVADFAAYMRKAETGALPHGPAAAPPFHNAGGFSAVTVGGGGWVDLDLPAGTYVATDFIPNIHTGIPDVAQGMLATFEVRS
jgi:hypothetical protein